MNFCHHKDLGNHLLQLCPKVVKHPLCVLYVLFESSTRLFVIYLKMQSVIQAIQIGVKVSYH